MNKWKFIKKTFERQRLLNKAFAKPGKHKLIVVLDNLKPDFNIGKIFRSGDCFSIEEVMVVGTTFFDPRTSVGTFKTLKASFYEDFDSCYQELKKREKKVYAFCSKGEKYMHQTAFDLESAFIFGHEEYGLSFDPEEYPEIVKLKIAQFGISESLNVSVAASVTMYEYVRQHVWSEHETVS